jgi:hypothetical protein
VRQNVNGNRAPRYAVAVFGEWPLLLSAIRSLAGLDRRRNAVTILGQTAAFADPSLGALVKALGKPIERSFSERFALEFSRQVPALTCTKGPFATQLAIAAKEGRDTLLDALKIWMPETHAARIDNDLKKAHLHLWNRVFDPEGEQKVSLLLLKMRPLRVEVRDLRPMVG